MSNIKFQSFLISFDKTKLENNDDKPNNHHSRKFISQIYTSYDC
jgi:hypothetical protein